MSIANHRRRLDRLEKASASSSDGWIDAVFALDREKKAAVFLVRFAQALAGTDETRAAARTASPHDEAAGPAARAAPAPPGEPVSRWSRTNRPGPRDVITREEFNQLVRWQWEDDHPESQAPSNPHATTPGKPPQGEKE